MDLLHHGISLHIGNVLKSTLFTFEVYISPLLMWHCCLYCAADMNWYYITLVLVAFSVQSLFTVDDLTFAALHIRICCPYA